MPVIVASAGPGVLLVVDDVLGNRALLALIGMMTAQARDGNPAPARNYCTFIPEIYC